MSRTEQVYTTACELIEVFEQRGWFCTLWDCMALDDQEQVIKELIAVLQTKE